MKVDKAKIQRALYSSKTRKYGLWGLAVFALAGILGFLALPPVIRHVAVGKLSEALHRPVSIRSVSVNPYALSLTVEGVDVKEREGGGTFAGFESLYLDLQASSLFRWGLVIDEIRLTGPKLHVARLAENVYNFSDLAAEFTARPEEKENGPPPAFSLNNIRISGGSFEF
ncbi:MAG: AsmA family protein, partial [Candidatus Accumulibacter sp.]|nr:AsmA family protein [Accumulibacter sp.]